MEGSLLTADIKDLYRTPFVTHLSVQNMVFATKKSNLSPGIFWMIRKRPNKMTSIFLDTPEFKALESQPFPKTHFQSVAFAKAKRVWMQVVL